MNARVWLIVIPLFVLGGMLASVYGVERSLLFKNTGHHYTVALDENTRIDWTGGYIFAKARTRLPRISVRDEPGTARSITEARFQARETAHEQASLELLRAVGRLRVNSDSFLLNMLQQDRDLRERMATLTDLFLVKSRHTSEGYVSVELALPFHGKGLYSLLAGRNYARGEIPRYDDLPVTDDFTGLIIDTTEFPGFQPSLEPSVFTDVGRQIYGPEVVSRRCVIRRGLAAYYTTREHAQNDNRVGLNPLYTFAAGTTGPGKSNVFLDSEDALRMIASESGRKALSRCAVVFVVRK